jgi:uncharacterized protein with HEPN domain
MPLKEEEMKLLFDINECCVNIKQFVSGVTSFTEYERNILVKKAIERDLITIGEAIVKINKISSITLANQEKIRAFRNRLVHDYNGTSDELVWVAVTKHLPALHIEVKKYLE